MLNDMKWSPLFLYKVSMIFAFESFLASCVAAPPPTQLSKAVSADCAKAPSLQDGPDFLFIREKGCFFLENDVNVGWISKFPEGGFFDRRAASELAVLLDANGIILDLNGRQISSTSSANGIRTLSKFSGLCTK